MTEKKGFTGLMYNFYGDKDCVLEVSDSLYRNLNTPARLYDALSNIWCSYTCAPRMRKNWTEENKTLGQCSVTAFLVQDIFGGKVYGIPLEGGGFHCFNVVGEHTFDLTSEQFGDEVLDYDNCSEQLREEHFAKQEKLERYLYLKEKLEAFLR